MFLEQYDFEYGFRPDYRTPLEKIRDAKITIARRPSCLDFPPASDEELIETHVGCSLEDARRLLKENNNDIMEAAKKGLLEKEEKEKK